MRAILGTLCGVVGVIIGAAAPVSAQHDCYSSDLTPTVISGDEIRRAGIIRLSGILRLMPDWHTTSTDFYLWEASPGIQSLPEWSGMQLAVDGQPLSSNLLGTSHLNAYPLDVGLIDSVVVYEGSVLCDGLYAPSGLISIHTRLERGYLSAGGAIAMANESGDPGPYLFTEHESTNIDRSGPVGMLFGGVSGQGWHIRGQEILDEHHVTDVRLLPRVRRIYKQFFPPRDFLDGRRADAKVVFPGTRVSASVDEAHFEHFRFMPGVGSEVPMSYDWSRIGAHAGGRVRQRVGFFFSAEQSVRELSPHPDTLELDIRWKERSTKIHGGVQVASRVGQFGTGFSGFETRVSGRQSLFDPKLRGQAWFFMYHGRPVPEVSASAMFRISREEERPVRSGSVRVVWTSPVEGLALLLGAASDEIPAYELANAPFWAARGLDAPAVPGMFTRGKPSVRAGVRRTASAGLNWRFRTMVDATLSGQVADFEGFPVTSYARSFMRDVDKFFFNLQWFETESTFHDATAGRMARVSFESSIRPFAFVHVRLYHARTSIHSDDAVFSNAWAIVPARRSYASVTLAPRDRVSLHARLSYESESFWPEFSTVAVQSDGLYPERLPSLALLDVALTKRFWHHHLQVSVMLSNVLNRPFRRHPAGATESISLSARVQVEI